ncbi:NAD(P)H-quinone oxidoreductase [Marisediminicola senii]|uniref:NAD(P)H-quinone oxidoreductase n=1 Tax=Marisediminicola senii TaxID=2711233 RepID=UPI0013EBDC6B|nr:NAD(P)H-quinone oxidoreductase [Marisediminicola senii]
MRVIEITTPGDASVLREREVADPVAGPGQVVIDVAAAGVNRADISQREGRYPPPPGSPDWPGLEVSGTIRSLGDGVATRAADSRAAGDGATGAYPGWAVGDRVCALLGGGGYASQAVANVGQLMPVPAGVDLVDAAALPEAVATVWSNVFMVGRLQPGETLLVHGGSSGVGTMAIQIAAALGSRVAVTAGSARKLDACAALGASILIDYRSDDFVARIADETGGTGVDVILDPIGGEYVARSIQSLNRHGRLVLIGNQSGEAGTLNIGALMGTWGSVHATSLRARPLAEKNEIVRAVIDSVWPLIEAGTVSPVVDEWMPLADARRAHERMERSDHIGKLLLVP